MRNIIITTLLMLLCVAYSSAQTTYRAQVVDGESLEPLIGAVVQYDSTYDVSDQFGYFSISIMESAVRVLITYTGYDPLDTIVVADGDASLVFSLKSGHDLEEVVITAKQLTAYKGNNALTLDVKELSKKPSFLGEPDPIKYFATAAGVTSGYNNSSGLFVRGGTPDQNLVLLDDAMIYNSSHLYGFTSSFNADVLKKVDLHKSNIPARFGNRLSAVIDVRQKDGNKLDREQELTISPLFSKYYHNGYITRGKSSLVVAARTSYLYLFTLGSRLRFNVDKAREFFNYSMYDVNAVYSHLLRDDLSLKLSLYKSGDFITNKSRSGYNISSYFNDYGNFAASAKVVKSFGPNVTMNNTVAFSNYKAINKAEGNMSEQDFIGEARISVQNVSGRSDFEIDLSRSIQIQTGVEVVREHYDPTSIKLAKSNAVRDLWGLSTTSVTAAAYMQSDISIADRINLRMGLRAGQYISGQYKERYLEPRVGLSLSLSDRAAIFADYNRMNQTANLLANNGLGLATDFWLPAVAEYPMSQVEAYSAGLNFSLGGWDVVLSAYKKDFSKLISLRAGADYFQLNRPISKKIQTGGLGKAWGVEFTTKKRFGRGTAELNYTYAHNDRKFEGINKGNWFPFKYDIRHQMDLLYSHRIGESLTLSARFNLQTGAAYTLPTALYFDNRGDVVYHYSARNNARFPLVHQLDISGHKETENGEFIFGIQNVYAKRNPVFSELTERSIYKMKEEVGTQLVLKQVSFGLPIPYIGYKYRF